MARWLEQSLPMVVQEYLGATATAGVGGPGTPRPGSSRI